MREYAFSPMLCGVTSDPLRSVLRRSSSRSSSSLHNPGENAINSHLTGAIK